MINTHSFTIIVNFVSALDSMSNILARYFIFMHINIELRYDDLHNNDDTKVYIDF